MIHEYHTRNLILKILPPSQENASAVLDFFNRNKEIFETYEAARPHNFYTEGYQMSVLTCEYTLILKNNLLRFWIYEKNNPNQIIGTISFYHIMHSVYERCETGYKFDQRYWRKGYAKEAMQFGISIIFENLNLHRIEAFVMKDNIASIRLLESLDFVYEGTCRQAICIRGQWEDHMLFSLLR